MTPQNLMKRPLATAAEAVATTQSSCSVPLAPSQPLTALRQENTVVAGGSPAVSCAPMDAANLEMKKNKDKITSPLAAASGPLTHAYQVPSSPGGLVNNVGDLPSRLESEHLKTPITMSTSSTTLPSLSSANNNIFNIRNYEKNVVRARPTKSMTSSHQWKNPSHSCTSLPSSLSPKSRGSQGSNSAKPHAYFASSEEESEAELDEKDSHSSRDRGLLHCHVLSGQRHVAGNSGLGKSNLRGSKKLAEIASKVGFTRHPQQHSLHSSRVRMTIPTGHNESGTERGGRSSNKPIITSIYKTNISNQHVAVPPPPATVTVAVGKKNGLVDGVQCNANMLPSPNSGPLPYLLAAQPSKGRVSSSVLTTSGGAALNSVNLKRIRKKKRRSQRHLPRGLPVFKDPRSCMWTSTHDANAPSEDRYSSLVNVLLRPPKTKKMEEGGENMNNGSGNNNNSGGSSFDGSNDEEDNLMDQHRQQIRAGDTDNTKKTSQKAAGANIGIATPGNNFTEDDEDNTSLIRLSLWSVIDGHGGGCVATYAAEVLLPHIAASVARALKSEIVDRGVCNVNGQLRDANALDLDGLIRSSDRSRHVGKTQVRQREAGIDVVNPNSIHYRSPYEDSESEGDIGFDRALRGTKSHGPLGLRARASAAGSVGSHRHNVGLRSESESEAESEAAVSVASSLLRGNPSTHGESVSSLKTSIKTAVSPVAQHSPVGTHSPAEVASITRAITDSFLAVDEGWINSIDPVTTHQTSCVSNGRWNAGACALVVFIVQRLDWCRSSRVDHEIHHRERGARGFEDTSHNKDAARRRKLDYATKSKSVSSLSTLSSTSSITTEANTTESMLVEESEITETDDDDDVSDIFGPRRRRRKNHRGHGGYGHGHHHHCSRIDDDNPHHREGVFIATPAGCKCHYYRPHDAMLYTAHVGDCRAVMLGSAPPRTIKVPPEGDSSLSLDHVDDTSEDDSSSESIADEISSSEHDSDSSGDMIEDEDHFLRAACGMPCPSGMVPPGRHPVGGPNHPPTGMLGYVSGRASKRQRRNHQAIIEQPFVPLPPLHSRHDSSSEESAVESDDSTSTTAQEHLPPMGSIVRTTGSIVRTTGRGVQNVDCAGERSSVLGGPVHSMNTIMDVSNRRPVFNNLEEEKLLVETEDEEAEEDEIKEIRSVRSGSPTQMDRPSSPTQLVADPVHPPPLPLSTLMRPIDLTTDHSAYNPAEVTAVLRRSNNAPKAISSASGGGIKRVAGSLAVTRALGDAYLKTPRLSFFPYKRHAPYITARPEVNCRVLTKGADRILTLASDGVWERASGDDVLRWVRNYYNARIAGVKEQHLHSMYDTGSGGMMEGQSHHDPYVGEMGKSFSRRKHGGKRVGIGGGGCRPGVNEGDVLSSNSVNTLGGMPTVAASGSRGEISSEDDSGMRSSGRTESFPSLVDNMTTKTPKKDSALAIDSGNKVKALEHSEAVTMSENMAAMTTAIVTTANAGAKRDRPDVVECGASSCSASSTSFSYRAGHCDSRIASRGIGSTSLSLRRLYRGLRPTSSSSRTYSLAIPTVSEVIVRKVLNKVRKTRNITSLRMLMSLPKGRARRSKHDDITATVVDLSGFVS